MSMEYRPFGGGGIFFPARRARDSLTASACAYFLLSAMANAFSTDSRFNAGERVGFPRLCWARRRQLRATLLETEVTDGLFTFAAAIHKTAPVDTRLPEQDSSPAH